MSGSNRSRNSFLARLYDPRLSSVKCCMEGSLCPAGQSDLQPPELSISIPRIHSCDVLKVGDPFVPTPENVSGNKSGLLAISRSVDNRKITVASRNDPADYASVTVRRAARRPERYCRKARWGCSCRNNSRSDGHRLH